MDWAVNTTAVLEDEVFNNESKALWIFAYGSLCWKPGFQFHKAVTGHVNGYSRRFWQGNTAHRGTEEKPGRVATLVEDEKGTVHGIAFAISGEAAIPYLSKRECEMGGYITQFTTFYPERGDPFNVLLYIATSRNPQWLGDANAEQIADQIIDCKGESGYNVEYLVRLADFSRHHFPQYKDSHLFDIEKAILNKIKAQNLCLVSLMGSGKDCITFLKKASRESSPAREEQAARTDSFEHTTRIPGKTLRCLNI